MLKTSQVLSPMMLQWLDCKQKCPHAILLFRLGDFYEAFEEDASLVSSLLDLTLTKRQDSPMCGVPSHALDSYVDKLLAKGFTVAIAEQVQSPMNAKGLMRREVVKVLSPGALIQSDLLQEKQSNYLLSISHVNAVFGLAVLDISTGDFWVSERESMHDLADEIIKIAPKEILILPKTKEELEKTLGSSLESMGALITLKSPLLFEHERACRSLSEHFQTHSLDAFGLKAMIGAINAAGAMLIHLKEHLLSPCSHIKTLRYVPLSSFMALDKVTTRHLELFSSQEGISMFEYLDHTKTPMGARLLRKWLSYPLLDKDKIKKRHDAVENLLQDSSIFQEILTALKPIKDIERLAIKLQTECISPRDLASLALSLKQIPVIIESLKGTYSEKLVGCCKNLSDFSFEVEKTLEALCQTPPAKLIDGNVFKEGFDKTLDEYNQFRATSQDWIAKYQAKLKEELQIKTLKIGFTRAFGYFIEVSKGQADKIPLHAERRQTLISSDRFITAELKEYEQKLFSIEEKIKEREKELFTQITTLWQKRFSDILRSSKILAKLDVLASFAYLAATENFTRPTIKEEDILVVKDARHPIVEKSLPPSCFVPNSLNMDEHEHRIYLITGPNMGGKSTFIRQIAILVILAQIGSFVPASSLHMGIVDKVFARIGASDNLAKGQSTFMVEMGETANILNHATAKSLVILDEIGRGTSTYDGIAIASAVVEHLASSCASKTLFATHYGELTDLEEKLSCVKNLHVSVQEVEKEIIFLHKIEKGSADRSYGIHVAKIAGMPHSVVKRAQEILSQLEKEERPIKPKTAKKQLELFAFDSQKEHEELYIQELKQIDLNHTTPLNALEFLAKWQKKLL